MYIVGFWKENAELKPQFEKIGDKLLVRAPAKINLSLLIAGKRPDGFHEIETVMAKINLYDELLFESGCKPGIELICEGKYFAPSDESNLVYRACMKVLDAGGQKGQIALERGIKVTLTKNIPVGAGLGGGSSDAASALLALNRFLEFGLADADIYGFASQLGSDVPFFLTGPLALCTGRGEKIALITERYDFNAILIAPSVNVATKEVYANYVHDQNLYLRLTRKINDFIGKKNIDFVAKMCANMLESTCFAINNELCEMKSRVESLNISKVCLSGSGSVMYILVTGAGEKDLERYQAMLKECVGCETIVVDNNRW